MTLTEFFLTMLFLAALLGTLWLASILTAIHTAVCRQSIYILEWRREMEEMFAYEDELGDEWIDEWEGRL